MSHHIDELSKSLADESVSRRQSFRRLGAALAAALLSPLGLQTARAGPPDACRAFCNQCPKSRRTNCLLSCQACNNDPSRLCGNCWGFVCCGSGETCCGNTCHDLDSDFDHCGACESYCDYPGPYEDGACIDGRCQYRCVEGAVVCNGNCSLLDEDHNNCGACGNVCAADRVCSNGRCVECLSPDTACAGRCVDLSSNIYHCGRCFNPCPGGAICESGVCQGLPGGGG